MMLNVNEDNKIIIQLLIGLEFVLFSKYFKYIALIICHRSNVSYSGLEIDSSRVKNLRGSSTTADRTMERLS